MDADGALVSFLEVPERYADLVNGVLFNGEQRVFPGALKEHDSRSLSKKSDAERQRQSGNGKYKKLYRDLVRRVVFGVNFAVIGVENQSEVHYLMPIRVMDYDLAEYKRQAKLIARKVKEKKGVSEAEFLSGFGKKDRLMPCVTIVLFYGDEWDGSKDVHGLLDFTDIPEELKKYIPNYSINIVNIRELENTDIFRTDIKLVFDFIRCSGDKEKLRALVNGNEAYKHMDEDAYDVATLYTKSEGLIGKNEYSDEGGRVNMCKALEDLYDEGRMEGRLEERMDILKLISMMFGAGESPEAVKRITEDENFLEAMRSKYLFASA